MTFLSEVEREFNEIFGETDQDENPESSKFEEDFNDLLSNVKKDVKTIPREDLWPSFPSGDKAGEDKRGREDAEFDADDARKALKLGPRRRDKRCTVGEKTYDIGERWKDEKTGKDMICILMNIPKEMQPRLEDADVTIASNQPPKDELSRPSVESEWEYSAYPQKKQSQVIPEQEEESKKQEENKEVELPEPEQTEEMNHEVSEEQTKQIDQEEKAIESLEPCEEQPEKEGGEVEEQDKENVEVSSEMNATADQTSKEPETELQPEPNEEVVKALDKDSDHETDSDFQKHEPAERLESENELPEDKEGEEVSEVKDVERHESVVDDNPQTEKIQEQTNEPTEQVSETPDQEVELLGEKETEPEVEDKQVVVLDADVPTTTDATPKSGEAVSSETDGNLPTTERGTPIYTKETVIKRRKLFKTKETIETTEPYKNKQ